MMMTYRVQYHWPAEAALNSMAPHERQQVVEAVERLKRGEFVSDPQVYRLQDSDGPEGPYVLRATDLARVVFRVEAGNLISIRDIINRQFAQRYG